MKKSAYILFVLLLFLSTAAFGREKKKNGSNFTDTISSDSTEYELIIIDPGFETWLATKPSMEYYSQHYYEYINRLYVPEWNFRYFSNKYDGEYDSYIDYDPRINYGLDLNYKLYYYFKYFEEIHGTRFYPGFR